MKIPKEFRLTKAQCKASTNEKGLLSKLPPLADAISVVHYSLICLLNGNKPVSQYSTNSYFYCPTRLISNIKIQILADVMKVKTILIKKDKHNVSQYVCYLDPQYEESAYMCAYLNKIVYYDASPKEQKKMISFQQPYNYLFGKLYGYSDKEIRGYYLQRYLLKSVPPAIKAKMMKHVSESNFDLDIVSYKTKLERLYTALKKVDNFQDFDSKFRIIANRAQRLADDISANPKYKAFKRTTKPKPFKFNITELKDTYPDDYSKYAPTLIRFQKSLTKK